MSFTTDAYAQTEELPPGAVPPQENIVGFLAPFVLIFIVFYFLILRPQQKKIKEHHAMISGIRRGDKVITSGGIIGKVTKVNVDSKTLDIEIAENVEVEVIAATVSTVVSHTAPVNDNAREESKKEKKAK